MHLLEVPVLRRIRKWEKLLDRITLNILVLQKNITNWINEYWRHITHCHHHRIHRRFWLILLEMEFSVRNLFFELVQSILSKSIGSLREARNFVLLYFSSLFYNLSCYCYFRVKKSDMRKWHHTIFLRPYAPLGVKGQQFDDLLHQISDIALCHTCNEKYESLGINDYFPPHTTN